jgi:hypothetical protein
MYRAREIPGRMRPICRAKVSAACAIQHTAKEAPGEDTSRELLTSKPVDGDAPNKQM